MADVQDRALSWDDEISQESEFILLEPGVYDFEVTGLDKAYFNGSDKMQPCPQARLELTIDKAKIYTNLFLNTKAEWKLSEFFISIGLKKKGEPLKMQWNKVLGAKGRCEVGHREWDGKNYNEVSKFLEPLEKSWKQGSWS